jgi:A/G-specific adenine glycosylase
MMPSVFCIQYSVFCILYSFGLKMARKKLYQTWQREKTRKFQELILAWYSRHKRKLPWRVFRDPYRIWISEIMLQQTQVQTVLPYYKRFLKRFPSVEKLAAAPEGEVLALWAGLGYYSRARSLHRAARMIVEEYDGEFPVLMDDVLELPGVGRYTAGAILSIAWNQEQPVVDGNVRRVMSRLHAIDGDAPESFFWNQASSWIPEGRASDFNQAVMELGALVCTSSKPLCRVCPVDLLCQARQLGIQDRIPLPRSARATESIRLVMLVLQRRDCILLSRHRKAEYLPGEWGLPTEILSDGASAEDLAQGLTRALVCRAVPLKGCATVRHSVTYRRILIDVFQAELNGPAGRSFDKRELRWVSRSSAESELTSSAYRKALRCGLPRKRL